MRYPWIRSLACVAAVLLPACDSGPADPPAGFPYALAMSECGPADGPAVGIELVQDTLPALPPGGPHVRVYLWRSLDELTGRSWSVGGSSQDGVADYWDSTGGITALRGTVDVLTVGADTAVEGEVDLVSGGTFRVRGGFRARWVTRSLICG
jgi:hypothetical protein